MEYKITAFKEIFVRILEILRYFCWKSDLTWHSLVYKTLFGIFFFFFFHRIIEPFRWEKILKIGESNINLTLPSHYWNMSLSATFAYLFNTSRNGDLATSLGILFQYLKSFSVKDFFLICTLNHLWDSLRPFFLALSLITWEKRPPPPGYKFLSGTCRAWCGLPWDSFFPG